jgi:hypothetical protein
MSAHALHILPIVVGPSQQQKPTACTVCFARPQNLGLYLHQNCCGHLEGVVLLDDGGSERQDYGLTCTAAVTHEPAAGCQ